MPAQINVPTLHLFINVSVQSDASTEGNAALEPAVQELVDLIQTWSGRIADVTAQLYDTTLAPITPTNPDPPLPPPLPE
jgi:hypothetical protein